MKPKRLFKSVSILAAVMLVVASGLIFMRPVPEVTARNYPKSFTADTAPSLIWPNYGQSAIGASGYGILASYGETDPVPIASIAKVITALSILERRPLISGQVGPTITITEQDVQLYNQYVAKGGSVTSVKIGQQITQYEALQAMLLPSSNNIADTTATWAFGSLENYISYANSMLSKMGLRESTVADASGFSPKTRSTANDLVMLAEAAMANPVIAEIVSQKQAEISGSGKIKNVNTLLGESGIDGIKTGNTEEAGGCYLFSSTRQFDGEDVRIIGVILGAPTRNQAMADSRILLGSASGGFNRQTIVQAGETVGTYLAPWGAQANSVAVSDLSVLVWRGSSPELDINLSPMLAGTPTGTNSGSVTVLVGDNSQSQPVKLDGEISAPPVWWRLFR